MNLTQQFFEIFHQHLQAAIKNKAHSWYIEIFKYAQNEKRSYWKLLSSVYISRILFLEGRNDLDSKNQNFQKLWQILVKNIKQIFN